MVFSESKTFVSQREMSSGAGCAEREVKQQAILRQDVYREKKTKTTDKPHNRMFQGKVNPPSCNASHCQRNSKKLLEVPETEHIH